MTRRYLGVSSGDQNKIHGQVFGQATASHPRRPFSSAMRLFIMVGSTRFDNLVSLATSPDFLFALSTAGYDHVRIQYGNSEALFRANLAQAGTGESVVGPRAPLVEGYKYKESLREDLEWADLVVSHAGRLYFFFFGFENLLWIFPNVSVVPGSGSILEALRQQKRLVVVVNETLMDNHQVELAQALQDKGYLVHCTCSNLLDTLQKEKFLDLRPFPAPNPELFASVVDEQMRIR
ncbi:hypothetical protein BC937DRAFT_92395 [Endogone sp. FLAS-F59071]|nr:hypothetical protein BC937DRAFT_92395 [Endogone sp. FLAS-F59071]|eukprot:RUS15473.1 hypothetical protein BC937DRAFT_92395 [Endogone sp. FLAS-F59071]